MKLRAAAAVAALLVAGCASSGGSGGGSGAVVGRVLSAPSCPVERAGQSCPPRLVSGAAVVVLRAGQVISSTHTDSSGRFHLSVAAGRCVVRATNTGGLATTAAKTVTVRANQTIYVRLVVDSGIR